jgi:hypothetical protein
MWILFAVGAVPFWLGFLHDVWPYWRQVVMGTAVVLLVLCAVFFGGAMR